MRLIVVCLVLAATLLPSRAASSTVRIAVVLSRDVPPYREALQGFESVLQDSGRNYKLLEFTADSLAAARGTLAEKIRAKNPDLIFTIGSAATNLVSEDIHDLPIVFSMVLSSSGNQTLQEQREAHGNLTGASMEIPIETQFKTMKEVLPGIRRVGVLYNPELSSVTIDEATKIARDLKLELVPLVVASETDVLEVTGTLGDDIDVLWSVADSTVFSHHGLKHILLQTLRDRIPFVGLSPSFVKAGALLAISTDYSDLGRQAGEQCLRILAGEEIAMIPVTAPRNLSLSINMNTAKQIQIEITDEIQMNAHVFF